MKAPPRRPITIRLRILPAVGIDLKARLRRVLKWKEGDAVEFVIEDAQGHIEWPKTDPEQRTIQLDNRT
jgi:hypothetical protein